MHLQKRTCPEDLSGVCTVRVLRHRYEKGLSVSSLCLFPFPPPTQSGPGPEAASWALPPSWLPPTLPTLRAREEAGRRCSDHLLVPEVPAAHERLSPFPLPSALPSPACRELAPTQATSAEPDLNPVLPTSQPRSLEETPGWVVETPRPRVGSADPGRGGSGTKGHPGVQSEPAGKVA